MKHIARDIRCSRLIESRDRFRESPLLVSRFNETRCYAVKEIPLCATGWRGVAQLAKV
jgi:hypothetical protein